MKFTIDKDIGEPDSIITEATKIIAQLKSEKINHWARENGVRIDNYSKFRIEIHKTPRHKADERYDLYPARGRNAKKIISSLYI